MTPAARSASTRSGRSGTPASKGRPARVQNKPERSPPRPKPRRSSSFAGSSARARSELAGNKPEAVARSSSDPFIIGSRYTTPAPTFSYTLGYTPPRACARDAPTTTPTPYYHALLPRTGPATCTGPATTHGHGHAPRARPGQGMSSHACAVARRVGARVRARLSRGAFRLAPLAPRPNVARYCPALARSERRERQGPCRTCGESGHAREARGPLEMTAQAAPLESFGPFIPALRVKPRRGHRTACQENPSVAARELHKNLT